MPAASEFIRSVRKRLQLLSYDQEFDRLFLGTWFQSLANFSRDSAERERHNETDQLLP
jgi:hypothetical protein